jgi:D-beta-D-heptose 7-phosphate kinase/D-beta-D-heptose 1-phosphate adenosyltransferase
MAARSLDKVLGRRALRQRVAREQRRGRRVVFTNGCFDLLHVGHLRSLEQARGLGDLLVVGVNRDRRVRELKGPGRPLIPARQRAELVAGLACVDYVALFGEDTPVPLIRALQPDVVAKGGEYRGNDPPEKQVIEALGGRFVYLRQIPGVRSTLLVQGLRRPRRR